MMDYKQFGRNLTAQLTPHVGMSSYLLQTYVDAAIRQALRVTEDVDELVELMRAGIVRFSYTKKEDGSTREAIGTLKPSILAGFAASRKTRKTHSNDCVIYFDLEREDWRCFCPENFITRL